MAPVDNLAAANPGANIATWSGIMQLRGTDYGTGSFFPRAKVQIGDNSHRYAAEAFTEPLAPPLKSEAPLASASKICAILRRALAIL
jgi:hypothetical protein